MAEDAAGAEARRQEVRDLLSSTNDLDPVVAWQLEGAIEVGKAHNVLDRVAVPRHNPDSGNRFSLAARIAYLLGQLGLL